VKTFLLFLMVGSLSTSALAQAAPRLDPSATRAAVTAAAAAPHQVSRIDRVIRNTVIGAGVGAATGWLVWAASRDCGTCGGAQHAVVSTALFGAGVGAWIGVVQGWGAGRHPDIRISRRVTAGPAVSPSQAGGVVTVAF